MQQQLSVITLGVADLSRSRRFYSEGFGWEAVFANEQITFIQMNGFVLGLFERHALAEDMNRANGTDPGSYALAHNVARRDDVEATMAQLVSAGGTLLRPADAPPHGGYRGYVADPDGHAWEIAWNPTWQIDERGLVTFGL